MTSWAIIEPDRDVAPYAPALPQPIEWSAPMPSSDASYAPAAMGDDPEPTCPECRHHPGTAVQYSRPMGALTEYGGQRCLTDPLTNGRGHSSNEGERWSGFAGPSDVDSWRAVAEGWLNFLDKGDATRAVAAVGKFARVQQLRTLFDGLSSGTVAFATGNADETIDSAINIARELRCIYVTGAAKLEEQGKPVPPPEPEPEPDDKGGWTWPTPSPSQIPWWAWLAGGATLAFFLAQSPPARAYRANRGD